MTPETQSIAIAFCDLAQMLGKAQVLSVVQLASVLERRSKNAAALAASEEVLDALAHRLRHPST